MKPKHSDQAAQDVALIARNAIDRIQELEAQVARQSAIIKELGAYNKHIHAKYLALRIKK